MAKYQFRLRSLLLATFVVAILIWTLIITVNRTTRNMEATRSAYAAQLVAYMCVEHMKANNQAWPSSWNELDDDLDTGFAQSGQKSAWTFADLKQRVDVNWNADLKQLESNPSLDPVVWITDFPDRKHYMTSPNEIVSRHLKSDRANAR